MTMVAMLESVWAEILAITNRCPLGTVEKVRTHCGAQLDESPTLCVT
jgi:hypothetical protein